MRCIMELEMGKYNQDIFFHSIVITVQLKFATQISFPDTI